MIDKIKNKKHLIIKRDGRLEPYNEEKLYKVVLWACDGNEVFAQELINAIEIKIYNKIKIQRLYDEVIETASNMISDLYPRWDNIARNLFLLKIHKDMGVKRVEYPRYMDVLALNESHGLYDLKTLGVWDIAILADAIEPERDKLFTFGGLNVFVQKYCNKDNGQLLELPQHVYMRVAIQLMRNDGVEAIIEKYNQISLHRSTEATPKMTNSLKPNAQLFSCVLARPEDSLESLNAIDDMLGRESKFGGGLATDMSAIRAKGSKVKGNNGSSGGVIPFIQKSQWAIGAYNQGSVRSSSMAVYFNWFHYESPEIASLKFEHGKDEDRARRLKYAIKWNKTLSNAIEADEDVWLIDPHETTDLTFSHGSDWIEKYDKYSKRDINKRKYKARDLAMIVAKAKAEHGNLYTFFTDNANEQDIGCGDVNQSNLCCEFIPSFKPITHIGDELVNGEMVRKYDGEIALCNLASVNLFSFMSLTSTGKENFINTLVRSCDNAIDTTFYANDLGEKHSNNYRDIGIGALNYANILAFNEALWNSEKARRITHEVSEELSFYAIKSSIQLAKEKSRFPMFTDSKWAKGLFPHEISILGRTDSELNYPLLMDWESLRGDLMKHGIRNHHLLAIAPNAGSGKAIGATEGVNPIHKLKTIEEGTYSLPFMVPNLRVNREYYATETTYKVDNKDVIELAAIRQKFIDMGQSVSLAYAKPDSAHEIIKDTIYAEKLGLKSLYYTKTPTGDDMEKEACESCEA